MPLDVARLRHPLADRLRLLAPACGGKLAKINQRDLDMKIDPVEQGTRDSLAIALDLAWRTAALPFTIAIVAARMRIPLGEILSMKS